MVERVALDLFVWNSLEFSTSPTFHTYSITLTLNLITTITIITLFHVFALLTIIKTILSDGNLYSFCSPPYRSIPNILFPHLLSKGRGKVAVLN